MNLILPIPKSSVRKNLEKDLIKHNITLVPKIEVETTELIISSVKRNLGVGYVIKSAVENELKRGIVKLVEFPDSLPNIDINLVYIESCLTYPSRKIINYYIKPNNF